MGQQWSYRSPISDKQFDIFMVFSILNIDWRYQIWQAGVTITDNSFLYSLWYFTFSVLGNFNNFFFAAHLLDVAVGFKTLRTILQSVTHNGKQLVLTVMLLTIIVYIYTVIAFNFFRKFYIQEEDEEIDKKCHDMATVRIENYHFDSVHAILILIVFSSASYFIYTKESELAVVLVMKLVIQMVMIMNFIVFCLISLSSSSLLSFCWPLFKVGTN